MKIHWIGHSCFKVTTGAGQVIYFDPYEIEEKTNDATLVLCSHDHYDHAEEGSIDKIFNPKAKLICPKSCLAKLKTYRAIGIDPGEKFDVGGIEIHATPAYTPTKTFHVKANKYVGFIISLEGKTLFHAGDTDFIEEFKQLPPIEVALLPVGGTYTMDFQEALQAVKTIKPRIVVPMHAWDTNLEEFAEMVRKDAPDTRVEILTEKDLEI
ncbi:MAG: metal dependent hydrolase [Promethearchaeota archaeon CR_4]|nr:MAG: metal dependent hydrolase [Candidatus Lokiarchaeota archaeon CR_4]